MRGGFRSGQLHDVYSPGADCLCQCCGCHADAGLPASTLVRTWILEGISADAGTDLRSIVRQEVRTAVREALAG